ncbi:phosphoesterase [Xylogone sp. PMI_703]|nr:phosphoesterase [Xylogone sp. PMI_703]
MHPSAFVGMLAFATAASTIPDLWGPHPPPPHSDPSVQNLKSRIKNVVLLVMENRSVDNLLGGQRIEGLENPINNGPFCNPYNLTSLHEGFVCTGPKDYDSILDDPDHSISGNNIEFYGSFTPDNNKITNGWLKPVQQGFVHEQLRLYDSDVNRTELATQVMHYYTEKQVPVMTTLVQNFVTFNHWHSDVPGPTNPNRIYVVSGTSRGHGTNDEAFDESNHAFTQRSIFQQLTETGKTWKNYVTPGGGTGPEAGFFEWTFTSNNTDKILPLDDFYTDANAGKLADFTFINPSCCGTNTNSMHPTGLIHLGEQLIKNVYDALRASPQWKETLFILTFDETGGFHDHVRPPLAVRPDSLTYTSSTPSGENYTFEFDRLGGRVPTFLISPWVSKGHVEQFGQNSEGSSVSYSASSILRTLGYLWDFEPFTPRVEHAASFDHLIQRTARKDVPFVLPSPITF